MHDVFFIAMLVIRLLAHPPTAHGPSPRIP